MPRTTNKQSNKPNVSPITLPITKPIVIKNNTLFGSIKEGFGFSIGSIIARNMFGSSTSVQPLPVSKISCAEYNKCLELNDKYECFSNLDQREYVECRIANKSQ